MAESQRTAHRRPGGPDVSEAVRECLRRSCYLQLRQVTCHFCENVLILRGQLPSYYFKQLAQELALETVMQLGGVEDVINHIEVKA